MSAYSRTAIRSLSIRGFRSIRSLEISQISDLVVLHGPNGAGKSNVLLAGQVLLRAVAMRGDLPIGQEQAKNISLMDANNNLGLRPHDFHLGGPPEIRIRLDIELGTKAREILRLSEQSPIRSLSLEVVIQLVSDIEIQYWFDRANIDGTSLGQFSDDADTRKLRQQIDEMSVKIDHQRGIVAGEEGALSLIDLETADPEIEKRRALASGRLKGQTTSLRSMENRLIQLELQLDETTRLHQRIRYALVPKLLQISPAYRVPGNTSDPELELFRAALSEYGPEADAIQRLGRSLGKIGLFGTPADSIDLRPVSNRYGERVIHLRTPNRADLPIRNLGTGEQQIVYMLAQRVITPFPIAQIEEPEAHLHTSLMARFAHVLYESVTGGDDVPDVDQLWIATHHHHFALALDYYDVALERGATTITKKPRAKAATHFYEPGPIWEALRQLASSAKTRSTVVFRSGEGNPITAGEILDSIEKDPHQRIASEYARAMTEAMVLAMRQRSEKST